MKAGGNGATPEKLLKRIAKLARPADVPVLQSFFKTGAGQYGKGDVFLGVRTPVLRKLAKDCRAWTPNEAAGLLKSELHEVRAFALIVLCEIFKRSPATREEVFTLYLANAARINNWDLVDISAPTVVGGFLLPKKERGILRKLAKSKLLWERRIAIVSTLGLIRKGQFDDALEIAALLLNDQEDLLRKATGWMLREIGKRDLAAERRFLDANLTRMSRTTLRYAIERFPEKERRKYLELPLA